MTHYMYVLRGREIMCMVESVHLSVCPLYFQAERLWMLQLLTDGLRETADYHIYEKRSIFKLLLTFHDSALSDQATQVNQVPI